MAENITEQIITPEIPQVVGNEQLEVYIPESSNGQKGIVEFIDSPSFSSDGIQFPAGRYIYTLNGKAWLDTSVVANGIAEPIISKVNDSLDVLDAKIQSELASKVDKWTPGYLCAYAVWADGSNGIIRISKIPTSESIAQYSTHGTLRVYDAIDELDAVNKRQFDNKLDKVSSSSSQELRVYAVNPDGTQTLVEADDNVRNNALIRRSSTGASYTVDNDSGVVTEISSKGYVQRRTVNSFNPASENNNGYMTAAQAETLAYVKDAVDAQRGDTVRLLYTATGDVTKQIVEDFVKSVGYVDDTKWPSIAVVIQSNDHVWRYFNNIDGWVDEGVDIVQNFTNESAGIIKGSHDVGKISANSDGTGSVNGFDNKLDKVASSGRYRVYIITDSGEQDTRILSMGTAESDTIAQRNNNGEIIANDPTTDYSLTTKRYVDNGLSVKADSSDLSNYYTKSEADGKLAGKISISSATASQVYYFDGAAVRGMNYANSSAAPYTLARRQSDGTIKVGNAVNNDDAVNLGQMNEAIINIPNVHHYGARWNKAQAKMTRMYDAASFTTTTTNFGHFGAVNANYDNPFDKIYPWSGIRLCNIDIARYRALSAGDSITKCVTAWEGDLDFSYTHANGVWRYRPAFYGKSWEDETYRYFDASEMAIGSYVYYPEAIVGRWHGKNETLTIDGAAKSCLLPTVGKPCVGPAMSTIHTYAKNYGATIDSIYSIDPDLLLCIVEYADTHTQRAVGAGASDVYRQSSDLIAAEATNSTVVKVLASAANGKCIPHAIMDIGTSNGGSQVGSYTIVSVAPNIGDTQYLDVTLDRATTVTESHYWSIHGIVNVADEAIGSKSGYIGVNGKCNAYYRGIVLWGNMWFYTLGAYENKGDHHIWIANSDADADAADALNADKHTDTGLVLPTAGGYVKTLAMLGHSGQLSVPVFCTATGGDSANPVGDYFYNGDYSYNTVLLRGGHANYGSSAGAFCGYWSNAASYGTWGIAARPRLKNP